MKLGHILIAAAFLVTSSAWAGGPAPAMLSINTVTNLTAKGSFVDNGKIKRETVRAKDIAEALRGMPLAKNERLVALMGCPVMDMINYGGFYITVINTDTNAVVGDVMDVQFDNLISTDGKNGVDRINTTSTVAFANASGTLDLHMALTMSTKVVKKDGSPVDGENCIKEVQSKSLLGDYNGDPVLEGKLKLGKAKDGVSGTVILP